MTAVAPRSHGSGALCVTGVSPNQDDGHQEGNMKITASFYSLTSAIMALLALTGFERCASAAPADPNQGPGGPILVITSPSSTFGKYYAEILRTEGLNAFAVADIGTVTAAVNAHTDTVSNAAPQ